MDDIEHRFTYHPPPDRETIELHQNVRHYGYIFAAFIDSEIPRCREKSLAITKIEEAVMWANAAIARNNPPAQPERTTPDE